MKIPAMNKKKIKAKIDISPIGVKPVSSDKYDKIWLTSEIMLSKNVN